MIRLGRAALLVVILATSAGCSSGAGASSTSAKSSGSPVSSPTLTPVTPTPANSSIAPSVSSPTPAPVASPASAEALAVLVNFPNGTGPQGTGYDISLIAVDGRVVAHSHAATRAYIHGAAAAAPDLPEVSVAGGRVYYLDGDKQVRYLALDGTSALITTVPGSASAHAGFSVSPDGGRIAVSVVTYQGNSASMDLYVEDVAGGNHHDLLQSSSEYAWPVAWHSGDLVLAVGPLFSQQGLWDNPYFAANFQVLDAATGDRKAQIGGSDFINSCEVSGVLAPTGVACYHRTATSGMGGVFLLLGWDGSGMVSPAISAANGGTGSIDPDQPRTLALLDSSRPTLTVISTTNGTPIDLNRPVDSWPCWLDDRHVLLGSVSQYKPVVVDLTVGRAQQINALGFCAAVLGGIGEVQ